MIRTGSRAEGFTLPAAPGEPVDVGAEIGGAPVVLLFFPLAFSSVCTTELCTMRDDWSRWTGLDAKVYGITADSPFVTARFREELDVPFPILSDFNRDVSRTYDALHADLKGLHDVPKRAAFVIGPDGVVAYDWVSDDPGQLPDFEAIAAAVESSRGG